MPARQRARTAGDGRTQPDDRAADPFRGFAIAVSDARFTAIAALFSPCPANHLRHPWLLSQAEAREALQGRLAQRRLPEPRPVQRPHRQWFFILSTSPPARSCPPQAQPLG